jgi:hypothetical protein
MRGAEEGEFKFEWTLASIGMVVGTEGKRKGVLLFVNGIEKLVNKASLWNT